MSSSLSSHTLSSIKDLMRHGLVFESFNKIQQALESLSPQEEDYFSFKAYEALALVRTGSFDLAYSTLRPLLDHLTYKEQPLATLLPSLSEERLLEWLLTDSSHTLTRSSSWSSLSWEEASRIFYELWREGWEEETKRGSAFLWDLSLLQILQIARLLMVQSYKDHSSPVTGSQIALDSWILGDDVFCREVSRQVLGCPLPSSLSYAHLESRTYAFLFLNQFDEALSSLRETCSLKNIPFHQRAQTRQQLILLQRMGLEIPDDLLRLVAPPNLLVFTGHSLDFPDQDTPCFPARLETKVREEMDRRLEELKAHIGYCMGAAGTELIFAEALLDRGGEINLVLPCQLEDFIQASVSYGGPRWEKRFRSILSRASSVVYATEQPLLGQKLLYRFAHQVLHGVAEMRSQYLGTQPHLLAFWNHQPASLPGDAAEFIDRWDSIETLHIVDFDDLVQDQLSSRPSNKKSTVKTSQEKARGEEQADISRHIKTVLFSDLSGYSKLQDDQVPHFLQVMERVSEDLKKVSQNLGIHSVSLNTWGDALFVVLDKAIDMALWALALRDSMEEHGRDYHFLVPLVPRISLHAGPVFSVKDAFTDRENYFGSHVNRAARLEPVTMVGQVFATQQFVALLQAELGVLRSEGRLPLGAETLRVRYVGIIELAKNFGTQSIYHLLKK